MSLFSRLTHHDSENKTLTKLKSLLPGSHWVEKKPTEYYLTLIFINDKKQQITSFLDIGKWLAESNTTLPGLSWLDIPEAYLYHWLSEDWNEITILNQRWVLCNVCRTEDKTNSKLLVLPINGAELLISSWPDENISSGKLKEVAFLQHTINFIIGSCETSASVVNSIENGDLLVIEAYDPHIEVNGKKFGQININEELTEVIVSELSDFNNDKDNLEQELLSYDWKDLPVTIKYVLGSETCKLSELETIVEGTQFPLPINAEKEVKIYVNGQLFAFGELITVDNQDLAVEVHTINKLKPNNMDVDYGNE